ncbi:DUF3244 domain-containing protein [Bacteroides sp.]
MRTITTILFLLIMFCNASANTEDTQQCQGSYISLNGHYDESKLNNKTQTRSLPILPITAFLDGTDLCIEFSSAISNLNIILVKEDVEIENRTISVAADQCETFDLSEYGAGSYQIVLTTPQGINLNGNF